MFVRNRSHKPFISKPVIQEVVSQEQPLEQPSIAEVALQKVEEVMRMAQDTLTVQIEEEEEIEREEPVEPIGDIEPAQVPADDIAFLLEDEQPEE